MKRVILKSEIRDEYEEKIAIERVAFTIAKRKMTKEIRDLASICDKRNVELELLTAELSASSVAFDEKIAAEVESAIVALEDSHDSSLLDQAKYFCIKYAKELANGADSYEVKLAGELEAAEDAFTKKDLDYRVYFPKEARRGEGRKRQVVSQVHAVQGHVANF